MQTALVLVAAVVLGLLGGWGTFRLLGQLALSSGERLTLTVALFPALLGEAAFVGLLVGRPGWLVPAVVCVVLGASPVILSLRRISQPQPGVTVRSFAGARRGSLAQDDNLGQRARRPGPSSWPSLSPGLGEVGPVIVGVALFAAGSFGTVLLTPLSAGALRIGDWVAHWFLVLVYLGQPLPDLRTFVNRVGDFGVISRPPLYNLEGGLLVGPLELQFWPFQLVTPLLALSVAGAGVLWARAIGGERAAWVVAGLMGLSPCLLQNAGYPWSKMVAAGLALLFLLMIRAAALSCRPSRARQTFVLAALCAGLGYVAHQTTIFYVLPTLLWLVWRRPRSLLRRPAPWAVTTWALGGLVGLLAFMPWQLWVLATYGLRASLEANPAWLGADVTDTLGDWLVKGGVAIVGTLVPLPALGALARGSWPTLDQLMRIQLALLTGALGISGCWLLARRSRLGTTAAGAMNRAPARTVLVGARFIAPVRLRRPPWLALVCLCGFLGQTLLQPNWHDTGDAAESMTPIVILGLAYVARAALLLGPGARRLFVGLVLAETLVYLGLWLWWAFGAAWTRDPNTVLASRYGLEHVRALWRPALPIGALLLTAGLGGSALLLWRSLRLGDQPVSRR